MITPEVRQQEDDQRLADVTPPCKPEEIIAQISPGWWIIKPDRGERGEFEFRFCSTRNGNQFESGRPFNRIIARRIRDALNEVLGEQP